MTTFPWLTALLVVPLVGSVVEALLPRARENAAKQIALLNGEGNTTGIIFDLKCNHGWKDKTTIEHEGEITVTMNLTQ